MGKTKTKLIDASIEETKPVKKGLPPVNTRGRKEYEISIPRIDDTSDVITRDVPSGTSHGDLDKKAHDKKTPPKKHRSQKYQKALSEVDKSKNYPIIQAIDIVKKLSYSKFNGTLEAHINTAQTGLHGFVSLPFVAGRKLRILTFGEGADQSGAGFVGTDSTIDDISKGKIDFDIIVTTPEWMPKLARVAGVLGPKGLMPNPKNGTITTPSADGLKKAVESFQAGKTEYNSEPKAYVIHLALGKLDQPAEELSENVKTLLQTIGKSRIKKVTLAPTIGPSVKLDLNSI